MTLDSWCTFHGSLVTLGPPATVAGKFCSLGKYMGVPMVLPSAARQNVDGSSTAFPKLLAYKLLE